VPWKNAKHGGVAQNWWGIELSTLTPGATTSGFTRKSTSVGPWLLNAAMKSSFPVTKYAFAAPIVTGVPLAAATGPPSSSDTM
jgi:hypothetical protein